MVRLLLIGGSGIIGKAITKEAINLGYEVTTIGLDKSIDFPNRVKQLIIDRTDYKKFKTIIKGLGNEWDIVVDIFEFDKHSAKQTYECFKNSTKHIFILSTVLVYDRSKNYPLPIKSNHPLSKKGVLGGYVDHKLDVENFWSKVKYVNWTILRPYHILGTTESLLGCIPDHNRDPKLLDRIKNDKPLTLCEEGNIEFNFINATDIARIIFKAFNNPKTFHKVYNAVNSGIITARSYYEIIAKELGKNLIINNKSIKEVWAENKGWQLTTLPHLYDVSDLEREIGFVPNISLRETIKDIIKNYKPITKSLAQIPVHQRMTLLPRPKPIKWLF